MKTTINILRYLSIELLECLEGEEEKTMFGYSMF